MKIVFFGTPTYVIPILNALNRAFRRGSDPVITAVVTQPPKPTDRKQIMTYSEVDHWAHKRDVPIYFDGQDIIKDGIEADLGIVAAYGELIPPQVIKYFTHGILVVHPSLLPKFRWGSPVQATILTGENPTGVTIMKMDDKFDHGPIVTTFREEVTPEDTTESLRERLFERSADVLVELLPHYISGKVKPKEQDHTKATFARTLSKEDGYIPKEILESVLNSKPSENKWTVPFITDSEGNEFQMDITPDNFERFVRAFTPWPGVWTKITIGKEEKRLKILKSHKEEGKIILDEVQLEGKNPVSWKQFQEAYTSISFI